jgi:hypothetical protein
VVERWLAAFAALRSVHLRARVLVTPTSAARPQGIGVSPASYEYWGEGGLYHILAPIDPRLGQSQVMEQAFDGGSSQLVMQMGLVKLLNLAAVDNPSSFVAMRNPLFLPIWFLTPEDSDLCPLCELRIGDLAQVQAARRSHAGDAATTRQAPQTAAFAGGHASSQNVQFNARFDAEGRVVEIERRLADGTLLDTLTLTNYRAVPGLAVEFPQQLVLARNDRQGAPRMTFAYTIDELEANPVLAPGAFTIARQSMDKIWDSDGRVWIKAGLQTSYGLCKQ